MLLNRRTKSAIAMVLAILIVAVPLMAQQNEQHTDGGYLQGRLDGESEAKGSPAWILAGLTGTYFCLLIGCAGIGVAYAIAPSPPASRLIGKSSEYVLGYTEAFKSKARRSNALYAAAGCTAAALINLALAIARGAFTDL